jgi:hypothetical protein
VLRWSGGWPAAWRSRTGRRCYLRPPSAWSGRPAAPWWSVGRCRGVQDGKVEVARSRQGRPTRPYPRTGGGGARLHSAGALYVRKRNRVEKGEDGAGSRCVPCASRSGVDPAGRLHAQVVRRHTRAQPRGAARRGRARERGTRRTVRAGTPLPGLGSIALYTKRPYAGKRSIRRVAVPERRCARCGPVSATSSSILISRVCFQNSVTPKSVNILENHRRQKL